MKISDILELTASQYEDGTNSSPYSCISILHNTPDRMIPQIRSGLNEMGLKLYPLAAFADVPDTGKQKARMLWLTWAALMAREQGL
ncbi:hypothetical protein UFOVP336_24 [uncultured Caudovirales phage]|uniref:Uncharacterized protein n=1 Tax=uncultured Caudovirales phage TaxID=2100421 RepID=A0A6J5M2A7_9CAUD|nr:hypothetical protein UFOVP336_24 [uncultured Caudovirales phage]